MRSPFAYSSKFLKTDPLKRSSGKKPIVRFPSGPVRAEIRADETLSKKSARTKENSLGALDDGQSHPPYGSRRDQGTGNLQSKFSLVTPKTEGAPTGCEGKNTSGRGRFTANNFNRLQNISNMFLPNFMKTVNKENFVKFSNISLSIKPFLYGKEKFSTVKTNCLEKMPLETPSLSSSNRRNNSDYTSAFFKNEKNQTSKEPRSVQYIFTTSKKCNEF